MTKEQEELAAAALLLLFNGRSVAEIAMAVAAVVPVENRLDFAYNVDRTIGRLSVWDVGVWYVKEWLQGSHEVTFTGTDEELYEILESEMTSGDFIIDALLDRLDEVLQEHVIKAGKVKPYVEEGTEAQVQSREAL